MSTPDRREGRGLPHALPAGETLLWQGSPTFRALAVGAFHVKAWSIYVAIMLAWGIVSALISHHSLRVAEAAGFWSLFLGVLALAMVLGFAFLTARTTIYTITSKRIVIRYGAAIQKHVNLPFRAIQAVGLRTAPDGTGDIVMTPEADRNLSYLLLWPHVRAGKRGRVEPVLRGIPDAAGAARVLAAALDPSRAPAAIMPIAASPQRDRSQDSDAMDALASGGHAA
ncbi:MULTISPECIES: photosynthetic complex putative assembly protein PuhB [Acidiphilium]|uniref:PH domain-containing protein n=1 Tax=Acidiphilium rubrum TaxID=526 RepID=A0A8G2FCX1_ACIRU|nr:MULTISPECIES: photosynthetic complex putative assembly protein PuhB [Acidiphilium]SIQ17530.1 PH domain-containing protein [Acidiphilium rubrum]